MVVGRQAKLGYLSIELRILYIAGMALAFISTPETPQQIHPKSPVRNDKDEHQIVSFCVKPITIPEVQIGSSASSIVHQLVFQLTKQASKLGFKLPLSYPTSKNKSNTQQSPLHHRQCQLPRPPSFAHRALPSAPQTTIPKLRRSSVRVRERRDGRQMLVLGQMLPERVLRKRAGSRGCGIVLLG